MDQFPTSIYTDPQCLEIILKKDKDANADYVRKFEEEIQKKLNGTD